MGVINNNTVNSGEGGQRGPRGVNGRGIESITTQDNNNGTINLTFTYDDGSEPDVFVNSLVSDSLIQLDKLTLEGNNNTTKFSINQADETVIFKCDTVDGLNILKNVIIGDDIQNETTISSDQIQSKTVSGTTFSSEGNMLLNGFKNRLKSTNAGNNCFLDISANNPDNIFRFVSSNTENEIALTMNSSDNFWDGQMVFNTLPRGVSEPVNNEDFAIKSYVDNRDIFVKTIAETAQLTAENAQSTANNAVSKTTILSQSIQSDFIIQGNPSTDKFVVKDEQNNKIFWVETTNDSIFLGGSNSGAKWGLFDLGFNLTFLLDTQGQSMRLGNEDINQSVLLFSYLQGMITTRTINGGIGYSGFKSENTVSSSSIQMLSSYNLLNPNKIQSVGGSGLLISSDIQMVISSPNTIFDTAQPIPLLQKNPVDFTQSSQIVNKVYVDDRVGGICSGTSASATAVGTNLAPQLLNPLSFLPNPSPTVPANYLKAGQSYQLNMSGTATFTNGNAFVITLQSALIVLGTISITVPNVTGSQTWELEADFTIRSILNNIATIACSFDFTYNTGAQDFIGRRSITISNTLPTNINNTLEVWIDYSAGSATSNITTELYILKKVIDV